MSLNDEVQRDYDLNLTITDLPDDVTLLTKNASTPVIKVSVKDKGVNLLSRQFSKNTDIKINYRDFANTDNNRLSLSETELSSAIRQFFGNTAVIVSQSPDSISVPYTTFPPVKVRVMVKSNVTPKPQYTLSGRLTPSVDSVLVYSAHDMTDIGEILTETITLNGLVDTTQVKVKLIVPAGCRAVPDELTVTVPVEPLVSKRFDIPVEPINVPAGMTLVTFPSTVTFSCLVPMSMFNATGFPVKAYADWEKNDGSTIPLEMSLIPDRYYNGSITPGRVEYIIESL